jgi:succinate dehydrogenase / fumarate reductase cytochrome b subunit
MINKRPKNLNLLTISFPIPAIVSILHRISGVILFLLLPVMTWLLSYSLASENHFDVLQRFLSSAGVKLVIWLFLAPLCYHLVAGIRHLLMDTHVGEDLKAARCGAQLTIIISAILILLVGVWLW